MSLLGHNRTHAPQQMRTGSVLPGKTPSGPCRIPITSSTVLFDLDNCGISLQTMSVYAGAGGTPQSIPITPTLSSHQEPAIRAALKIICGDYGLSREPIRDLSGASPTAPPNDRALEQTYTTDGSDPDSTGTPTLEIPVALGQHPQLLHMHVQLFGALAGLLDGTVSFGASSSVVCIPFDRTGSLVALSTKAKKFSWGEEFQA